MGERSKVQQGGTRRRWVAGWAVAATLALASCGPELSRISSVETLRILGVRKSAPYARPGESVTLRMLWEDGRTELPEEVQTFFAFWCLNPPGNAYSQCLSQPPTADAEFVLNQDEFTLTIPENALREDALDPDALPRGSAFVFYGVCAGELQLGALDAQAAAAGDDLLPLCVDENGKVLGAEDFVIGYSQIFVFEELRNENPILTGLEFKGQPVEVDCIDDECVGPYAVPDLEGCEEGVICLESCEEDGDVMECDSEEIEAIVARESVQEDSLSAESFGRDLEESIWVSYFIDRGLIAPEVKLVNDAELGFRDEAQSEVYPPAEPGPVRVWAVVRDNRGGTAWLRAPGYVRAR